MNPVIPTLLTIMPLQNSDEYLKKCNPITKLIMMTQNSLETH